MQRFIPPGARSPKKHNTHSAKVTPGSSRIREWKWQCWIGTTLCESNQFAKICREHELDSLESIDSYTWTSWWTVGITWGQVDTNLRSSNFANRKIYLVAHRNIFAYFENTFVLTSQMDCTISWRTDSFFAVSDGMTYGVIYFGPHHLSGSFFWITLR